MSRDLVVLLEEIQEYCTYVITWTGRLTYQEFITDRMAYDATLHNVQNIGELVKRLPPEMRGRAPDVPWRDIAGFRDVIVHNYAGLDARIVWATARQDVPALLAAIQLLLSEFGNP